MIDQSGDQPNYTSYNEFLNNYGKKKFGSVSAPKPKIRTELVIDLNHDQVDRSIKPILSPKPEKDFNSEKNAVLNEIKRGENSKRWKPTASSFRNNQVQNTDVDLVTKVPVVDEKSSIDKNNPYVKAMVYGTYRNMLKNYNNKANDFISTLPKDIVSVDKGVAQQLDDIAARGGLIHLNGRTNPKELDN